MGFPPAPFAVKFLLSNAARPLVGKGNQRFTAAGETSSPGGHGRGRGLFLLSSGGSRRRTIGRAVRAGPGFLRSVFRGVPAAAFQSKRSVRDKTLRRPFTDGTGTRPVSILDVFTPLFKNLVTFRAAVFINGHWLLLKTARRPCAASMGRQFASAEITYSMGIRGRRLLPSCQLTTK